jgi:cytochrome c oxidase cbb3-type subunit 3
MRVNFGESNLAEVRHFVKILLFSTLLSVGCLLAQDAQVHGTPAPAPARGNEAMRSFFGLSAPPDPDAVDRGQKLFVTSCGFCHGTNAQGGNSGPDLVRSVLVLHDEGTGKMIGPVILNGRAAQGMPKFPLTEAQIKDLAAFFLSRSQGTANRMDYKILNIVTGDPKAGEAYFQAHCATCHNAAGDLAHIAGKFDPVALQGRFLYPVTHRYPGQPGPPPDPKALSTVTITLRSGKKYSGVLEHMDDFNVTLIDSSGARRTLPLDGKGTKVEIRDPLKGHEELLTQYTDADMHNVLAYLETLK